MHVIAVLVASLSFFAALRAPLLLCQGFFRSRYSTVVHVKTVNDSVTLKNKGYGFVRFSSEEEANRALKEMNGAVLMGKAIHTAPGKRSEMHTQPGAYGWNGMENNANSDNAHTVFVGNLDAAVTVPELQA